MRSPYENIPESSWREVYRTEDYVISEAALDAEGKTVVRRTQYMADKALQAANKEEFNESESLRFADREVGALGTMVARVPLNVWFDQLRNKVKEGDHDHMTWWLNNEENRPYRTFRGKL